MQAKLQAVAKKVRKALAKNGIAAELGSVQLGALPRVLRKIARLTGRAT